MQWEIQARSRSCSSCGREFRDGDKYHCVLRHQEEEPPAMARQDFCEECWDKERQLRLQEDEQLVSWWKSVVRIPPPEPKEEAIKRSLAEQLLRKYLDFREAKYVNFCYILALMLERRRILSQRHTVEEEASGKTLIIYEHTRTGETLIIMDPHLTLSQVAQVQEQVKEILDSEQKARDAEQKQEDQEQSPEGENKTEEEPQK